jgi:gliding motility-associated protein GldM
MNVSKDILKAFVTVNENLEMTNVNFSKNTEKVMKSFADAKETNPATIPYYNGAVKATAMTEELYKQIEKIKHILIDETEKMEKKDTLRLRYADAKDNYDVPTHVMLGGEEANPITTENSAVWLHKRMSETSKNLLALVAEMQKNPKSQFLKDDYEALTSKIVSLDPDDNHKPKEMEDGVPITWEILNFYHLPLAGSITNLTKMQSDVKNLEAELVSQLSGASGKIAIKFNALSAKVVAPSSYITAGTPYKADIFLAASSTDFKADNMKILIGAEYDTLTKKMINEGKEIELVAGQGKYEVGTSGQGEQTFKGLIKFLKPNQEYDYYPFSGSYMVAAPSVAVSPDKMNVFYIGVPNPISVSAAGVSPTDLIVTANGGGARLTPKGAGKYEMMVSTVGDCNISVSAKTKDGTKSQGPPLKFRVKKIPDPVAAIGGKKGTGEIKKIEVQGIGAVQAILEGFDFQANFIVTSYELTAIIKGSPYSATGSGPSLTQEMKTKLSQIGTGGKIFIDNVKAKGPDGTIRSIPGVTLKVKS